MTSINIKDYVIGIITNRNIPFYLRKNYVLITPEPKHLWGYAGVLLTNNRRPRSWLPQPPILFGLKHDDVSRFKDGDIVLVDSSGGIRLLWNQAVSDNCLLLTESCNCCCLTCPQPPKKHGKKYLEIASRTLSLLDHEKVKTICLTGGEPTLHEEEFLEILQICKQKFPHTPVMVLTNGKKFSDLNYAQKIAAIGHKEVLFCVSLHADVDSIHDAVVGVGGSFSQTITGIQNLGRVNLNTEIRFVVSKMNYKRIAMFSNFIFRNFPYVVHVAFMGLEITGHAAKNFEMIWVDPTVYQSELAYAARDLQRKSIRSSIYNIPLCLLKQESWEFARKSISGWKNSLLPVCTGCASSHACCGVFTTSGSFQSPNIHPLTEAPSKYCCHK